MAANQKVDGDGSWGYVSGMSCPADNPGERPKVGPQETIGGFLAAALNMEDQISGGVYEDYTKRANWPTQLDEEVFLQIKKYLNILIEDTRRHHGILQALIDEHGQSKSSG